MKKLTVLCAVHFLSTMAFGEPGFQYLRHPAISKTHIVFSYGGDLWSVSRVGGDAIRLTSDSGNETNPVFSPDGSQIAFEGEYDGNKDVFVMPAEGGMPKRLTFHPSEETPVAWSPDGTKVIFRSNQRGFIGADYHLLAVDVKGSFPTTLPLPMAGEGTYSPDAARLAYMPYPPRFEIWKRYRGGSTTPIWIANLSDSSVEEIPRQNSNDFGPMWVRDKVYFLSDRSGSVSLFEYDVAGKRVKQLIQNSGLDMKSASATADAIVIERFGELSVYDLKSGKEKKVEVNVRGDLAELRPEIRKVDKEIAGGGLSPNGARAVFEARGEVFTVPAEKGSIRNLTNSSGAADRSPVWSPDGKSIAWFSDASGEYQLVVAPQNGMGPEQRYSIGESAFFYDPVWSPDSKRIAFSDNRLNLWIYELNSKKANKIDTDSYFTPFREMNPAWSPDSKWLAYTKLLQNHQRAAQVYSIDRSAATQISDGMSDAKYARFDPNGKYLYFTASNNQGLATAWLDMSSDEHQTTRSVYVVVLRKSDASPLAPESDEEKSDAEKTKEKPKSDAASGGGAGEKPEANKPAETVVDLEGISQRVLSLPIPDRDYVGMAVGKTGILYLSERPSSIGSPAEGPRTLTIHKFDLKTRKTEKLLENVRTFDIASSGEKMLYRQGDQYFVTSAATPPKPGEGALNLSGLEVRVDPRAEWRQMYNEVWRIERDFFYDPNYHGMNLAHYRQKYLPYLEAVSSRDDLNYLFGEMLGEFTVGHMFVRGGSFPDIKKVQGGLLGADFSIENQRYRFAKVFSGENWNPELRAPLTQPGVNVVAGEYLLAINGKELTAADSVYESLEGTAGKNVTLLVGPNPGHEGSREVVVVPVADENSLRYLAWIEGNRRKVDQLSGGKLAYVHLPNTAGDGLRNFNRYYFAQLGKQGAVIDERFNGGGQIADFIIDYLKRDQTSFFMSRYGEPITTPQNAIFGPKVMLINQFAGSGGDMMPWLFRTEKVGQLIGKRTWGGLVGILETPTLIDGGHITSPNIAFYNLQAQWEIENHGVAPDIEVEYDPAAARKGVDVQLEKAVAVCMEQLRAHPAKQYKQPEYPNYHRGEQTGSQ